jgi:hypothetical protein
MIQLGWTLLITGGLIGFFCLGLGFRAMSSRKLVNDLPVWLTYVATALLCTGAWIIVSVEGQ